MIVYLAAREIEVVGIERTSPEKAPTRSFGEPPLLPRARRSANSKLVSSKTCEDEGRAHAPRHFRQWTGRRDTPACLDEIRGVGAVCSTLYEANKKAVNKKKEACTRAMVRTKRDSRSDGQTSADLGFQRSSQRRRQSSRGDKRLHCRRLCRQGGGFLSTLSKIN